MAQTSLPSRSRFVRWLSRVLRIGQGPGETRSSATITRRAQAEAEGQLKGWH